MPIRYRPSKDDDNVPFFVSLAAPSGGGKTLSALRLATGFAKIVEARDKTRKGIFLIDTEAGRALRYRHDYDFMHGRFEAPFTPDAYLEAIIAAHEAHASVCIVDSMSHEHDGPGGLLEWHDKVIERMSKGRDGFRPEDVSYRAWAEPKQSHRKFVGAVTAIPMPVIFCFRAREKTVMADNPERPGKKMLKPLGLMPISADGFEYEMSVRFVLGAQSAGVPDLSLQASRVDGEVRALIEPGSPLDEALGERLARWNYEGRGEGMNAVELLATAKRKAGEGRDAFLAWYKDTTREERRIIKPDIPKLEKIADDAELGDDNPMATLAAKRAQDAEVEAQVNEAGEADAEEAPEKPQERRGRPTRSQTAEKSDLPAQEAPRATEARAEEKPEPEFEDDEDPSPERQAEAAGVASTEAPAKSGKSKLPIIIAALEKAENSSERDAVFQSFKAWVDALSDEEYRELQAFIEKVDPA